MCNETMWNRAKSLAGQWRNGARLSVIKECASLDVLFILTYLALSVHEGIYEAENFSKQVELYEVLTSEGDVVIFVYQEYSNDK